MFELKLTEQQLNVIGAALSELPFKVAAPVLQAINTQIAEQAKPKED